MSCWADFFCLAQRFRCAAAIFSRAAAERVRFFLVALLCEDAEGRPLRIAGQTSYGIPGFLKTCNLGVNGSNDFGRFHRDTITNGRAYKYQLHRGEGDSSLNG